MSQKVLDYLQTNRDHLLEKLTKFLSIPSVSTDRNYQEQVREAGQFIVTYLNEIGFDKVELQETKKNIQLFMLNTIKQDQKHRPYYSMGTMMCNQQTL